MRRVFDKFHIASHLGDAVNAGYTERSPGYLDSSTNSSTRTAVRRLRRADQLPPVARFVVTGDGPTLRFLDTSSDVDGQIAARRWRFRDGTGTSEASFERTFEVPTETVAVLTVEDDDGAVDITSTTFVPRRALELDAPYAGPFAETSELFVDIAPSTSSIAVRAKGGPGGPGIIGVYGRWAAPPQLEPLHRRFLGSKDVVTDDPADDDPLDIEWTPRSGGGRLYLLATGALDSLVVSTEREPTDLTDPTDPADPDPPGATDPGDDSGCRCLAPASRPPSAGSSSGCHARRRGVWAQRGSRPREAEARRRRMAAPVLNPE